MSLTILTTKKTSDYELIDSGEGEKLERFGDVVLSRPDPQVLWRKELPEKEWKKAHGQFGKNGKSDDQEKGYWNFKKDMPEKWQIQHGGLNFWIKPTAFKHVGIFPEQLPNWEWMQKKIGARIDEQKDGTHKDIEILNLFAYTGGATLACAHAGAHVVHVDGSKVAITWARENAELSGLQSKPIRWILDDVRAFVRREIKRGRKYHGIIMDPPAFGHGADNEVWKIEKDFLDLIESCTQILADDPLFFLVNGYSAGYSALAYQNSLRILTEKYEGVIEVGELAIQESNEQDKKDPRLLPCGIFARWTK